MKLFSKRTVIFLAVLCLLVCLAVPAAAAALGCEHRYDAVVTPPTCTEKGYTTYTCANCGDSYVDDYVDEAIHSYEAEVLRATCTEDGYTVYTCTVCGDQYLDDDSEATGHNYEPVVQPPLLRGALCHLCLHQLRRCDR